VSCLLRFQVLEQETDLQEFGKANPIMVYLHEYTEVHILINSGPYHMGHISIEAFAPGSRILIRKNHPRLLDHSLQKP